jgi:hypothetical protein
MQNESTDKDITIDKAILVDRINLVEGFFGYMISDNPLIDNDLNLKQQAENISTQLLSLKNNIQ